jgi:phospholipase C
MVRIASKAVSALLLSTALITAGGLTTLSAKAAKPSKSAPVSPQDALKTATPIKHVVVIFGENESFDHYFGTYPQALNPPGEPAFTALPNTPAVNGLTAALLNNNPNLNSANGTGASNPFRLDRSQAFTASQDHNSHDEQLAFDRGAMDLFPEHTGVAGTGGMGAFDTTGLVMGYYDGNTVTALWNYAQHFAMNDNSYGSQFGPSTPGAVNLVSGQTNGAIGLNADGSTATADQATQLTDDGAGGFTMYGDNDPFGDACSTKSKPTAQMLGKNIGDLLNAKNITWGWFNGGFDLTAINPNGTTGCKRSSYSPLVGAYVADYVPHHQPFQLYPSTSNPTHKRPSSLAVVGTSNDGGANHEYDTNDFFNAVARGNLPSVSFLKAPAIQDAHPGNSDPIDEQQFIVQVINTLEQSPDWDSTAVIIAYDDSDGWYDHAHNVVNPSVGAHDQFSGSHQCNPTLASLPTSSTGGPPPANALPGINGKPVNGRCGYGTRQPLLVISPYAKPNFVDHTLTDQSSIIRFIEDNWLEGERVGQGSFDTIAGPIDNMFDFNQQPSPPLVLDEKLGTVLNP